MKLHHAITDLLNKHYELVYVDYRDSLDGNEDAIQQAIQEQDWSHIDSAIDDEWIWDAQSDSVHTILENLQDEIESRFDVDEERAEEFIEKYEDYLRDEIYERDESTYLDDMIRHTSDPVCFYDTGYEVPEETWNLEDKEFKAYIQQIKRILGIKAKESKYDRDLLELLINASYGGRLVIYFLGDIQELMKIGKEFTRIQFENACIALIDTYNGSGHNVDLPGHKFSLPLDTVNIFLDKTIKYSYTYEVCGMSSNWCEATQVKFIRGLSKPISKSSLHDELDQERRYIETFKAGGCTPLDMDMQRHRDTYYLNEFPCGTHCPHCHTFWID